MLINSLKEVVIVPVGNVVITDHLRPQTRPNVNQFTDYRILNHPVPESNPSLQRQKGSYSIHIRWRRFRPFHKGAYSPELAARGSPTDTLPTPLAIFHHSHRHRIHESTPVRISLAWLPVNWTHKIISLTKILLITFNLLQKRGRSQFDVFFFCMLPRNFRLDNPILKWWLRKPLKS